MSVTAADITTQHDIRSKKVSCCIVMSMPFLLYIALIYICLKMALVKRGATRFLILAAFA